MMGGTTPGCPAASVQASKWATCVRAKVQYSTVSTCVRVPVCLAGWQPVISQFSQSFSHSICLSGCPARAWLHEAR